MVIWSLLLPALDCYSHIFFLWKTYSARILPLVCNFNWPSRNCPKALAGRSFYMVLCVIKPVDSIVRLSSWNSFTVKWNVWLDAGVWCSVSLDQTSSLRAEKSNPYPEYVSIPIKRNHWIFPDEKIPMYYICPQMPIRVLKEKCYFGNSAFISIVDRLHMHRYLVQPW